MRQEEELNCSCNAPFWCKDPDDFVAMVFTVVIGAFLVLLALGITSRDVFYPGQNTGWAASEMLFNATKDFPVFEDNSPCESLVGYIVKFMEKFCQVICQTLLLPVYASLEGSGLLTMYFHNLMAEDVCYADRSMMHERVQYVVQLVAC